LGVIREEFLDGKIEGIGIFDMIIGDLMQM
jgi:hypothetical protein